MKELNKAVTAINNILKTKTQLKRKKKSLALQNKALFISLINEIGFVLAREKALFIEFGIDKSAYDDAFFSIIDNLIQIKFGKQVMELINFYLYERVNPDGSINHISDEKGNEIILNNVNDLWELVLRVNPNLEIK